MWAAPGIRQGTMSGMGEHGSSADRGEVPYDRRAQTAAAVERVLAQVAPGGRVYWGCEYECPQDRSGVLFYVDRSPSDEPGSCTLTFGVGEVSAELDFEIDASVCDGAALFAVDQVASWSQLNDDPFFDLLWVGPAGSPERFAFVDSHGGQVRHPAASFPAIGAQLEAHVALRRPDVTLVFDPDWQRHRHPLGHLLGLSGPRGPAPDELEPEDDQDVYTLKVGSDGSRTVQATGQVMDFLLMLEIAHQQFLDGLDDDERARFVREEAWMRWTDGTFDPTGLRF